MKNKKSAAAGIISLLCILINIGGKALAETLELPLWLDSFGTIMIAYIYGPVGAAVVGAATNIAYSIGSPVLWGYALTSISVGVIVGLCARKGLLKSLFGVLTTGFLVTLFAVVISTPLNFFCLDGYTGNKWSDGVIDYLNNSGWNSMISSIVGEFYSDFVDKVLTMLVVAKIIQVYRKYGKKSTGQFLSQFIGISMAFAVCTAALTSNVYAEKNDDYNTYLRTVYNSENGLLGGTANDIAQTSDGVLWIGTSSGLYRYTGNEFRLMNRFSSIKNVNCFCVDEEGRLWIGTNDNGLSICINNDISNVLTNEDGLPSNSVRCIAESGNGFYYVGTTDALALVSISNGIGVEGVVPEINYAKSISVNGDYTAAVNDDGTLFLLKGSEIVDKVAGEGFTCCEYDESGKLFVGTSDNIIEVFGSEGSLVRRSSVYCGELSRFNSFNFSETGEMVVCAENGTGYVDNDGICHVVNLGKFGSSLEHTIFDYQGNIWFTSSRLGLLKLCRSPFTEIFTKLGYEETVVNAVIKWQDNFYFGTDSGLFGANSQLTEKTEDILTERLSGVRVRCLMNDSSGKLWISTDGEGVICADANRNVTVYKNDTGLSGNKFRSSIETKAGTVVLAGDHGISCIKNGRTVNTINAENGLSNPKTLCLLETDSGDILAGTDGNGIAVIRDGKVEKILNKEKGLSSDIVMRMTADEDGYFIVTSNSLCYMDKNYGNIRTLDKFPYYNNYDIIRRSDGMLFVLSSAGIYVISRDSLLGECGDYTLLEYSRGLRLSLTANSWNYIDENDTLYLCGGTGTSAFDLYDYSSSHRSYRMNLSQIEVDGKAYIAENGEAVCIPRGAETVLISPDIVNYSISNPNVSVYLEGFDENPKTMLLSELSDCVYKNIPAGEYTFRMAVLDDMGSIVSENSYRIIKEKEIYDEWWFTVYLWSVFVFAIFYLSWMVFRTLFQRTLDNQKRELKFAQQQIEMGNEAIMTIARTVDAKDSNTSEHSFRVSEYSVMIARKLGYSDKDCEALRKTALLHDIGKIGIPDSVLNKPGRLTDEEYAVMKTHVLKGAEILKNFTTIENIVEGAQYHHERYDGHGYMQGLKGEDIPLNARIIGIADAFDAMTANRVYRKQLDIEFVLAELKRCRGTQFDPNLTDIMLGLIDDGTIQIEKLYEESKQNSERTVTQ